MEGRKEQYTTHIASWAWRKEEKKRKEEKERIHPLSSSCSSSWSSSSSSWSSSSSSSSSCLGQVQHEVGEVALQLQQRARGRRGGRGRRRRRRRGGDMRRREWSRVFRQGDHQQVWQTSNKPNRRRQERIETKEQSRKAWERSRNEQERVWKKKGCSLFLLFHRQAWKGTRREKSRTMLTRARMRNTAEGKQTVSQGGTARVSRNIHSLIHARREQSKGRERRNVFSWFIASSSFSSIHPDSVTDCQAKRDLVSVTSREERGEQKERREMKSEKRERKKEREKCTYCSKRGWESVTFMREKEASMFKWNKTYQRRTQRRTRKDNETEEEKRKRNPRKRRRGGGLAGVCVKFDSREGGLHVQMKQHRRDNTAKQRREQREDKNNEGGKRWRRNIINVQMKQHLYQTMLNKYGRKSRSASQHFSTHFWKLGISDNAKHEKAHRRQKAKRKKNSRSNEMK